jgi:hypothetical protein
LYGNSTLPDQALLEHVLITLAWAALDGQAAPLLNVKAAVTVSPDAHPPESGSEREKMVAPFDTPLTVAGSVLTVRAKGSDGADEPPVPSISNA